MNIKWTKDEEELCKKLLLERKSYKEISKILGKNINTIKNKNYKEWKIYNCFNPEDIVNKKFGYWTVLELNKQKDKYNKYSYLCKCICGNIKNVNRSNLIMNRTTNCGCIAKIAKSINGKNNKKYNTYNLTNEYGIGYTFKGEEFYFDLEDYDKIKNYCWHKHQDGYMRTCLGKVDNKNKYILMHDLLVIKEKIDDEVDHINGIPYDNRKSNFRIVKHINNMKNIKMYKNNKSGYQGIHWSKRENKWKVYIQVDNKKINLGTFTNRTQAIEIRKKAEEKYFGKYNRAKEFKFK